MKRRLPRREWTDWCGHSAQTTIGAQLAQLISTFHSNNKHKSSWSRILKKFEEKHLTKIVKTTQKTCWQASSERFLIFDSLLLFSVLYIYQHPYYLFRSLTALFCSILVHILLGSPYRIKINKIFMRKKQSYHFHFKGSQFILNWPFFKAKPACVIKIKIKTRVE